MKWVEKNYRGDNSYARNTISNWLTRMSTNDPVRLAWDIKKGSDDVFFAIEIEGSKNQIRLYDPENDPTPIYHNISDDINSITSNSDISNTSKKTLINARLGQGKFREELINIWQFCSISSLKMVEILKASHIKPWAVSQNNERLDPFNGLLLAPNFDELFDKGFISFTDSGEIIISNQFPNKEKEFLGISSSLKLKKVYPENKKYLKYHRNNVLRK